MTWIRRQKLRSISGRIPSANIGRAFKGEGFPPGVNQKQNKKKMQAKKEGARASVIDPVFTLTLLGQYCSGCSLSLSYAVFTIFDNLLVFSFSTVCEKSDFNITLLCSVAQRIEDWYSDTCNYFILFFRFFCQYLACSEVMYKFIFGLNVVLLHKIKKMDVKRQSVSDLPSAHLSMNKIRDIVDCSKKVIDGREGLARKPRNGGLNKIRSEEFLMGMASNKGAQWCYFLNLKTLWGQCWE